MRKTVTAGMVAGGLILMVLGYFGAAPWGADTVTNSDPRFVFAPLVFVLGIVTIFSAAIVYEVLPDKRHR
jgi:Kef-type K+ transport system membrane component KefB